MKFSLAILAAALASTVVCSEQEQEQEEVYIPQEAIGMVVPLYDNEYPMLAKHGDQNAILVVNGTALQLANNDLAKRDADARPFGFRWTRYGWFEPLAKRGEDDEDSLAKRSADAEARPFGFRWTRYGWFEPLAKRGEQADEYLSKRSADADARPFGFRWTRYGWFEPLA
ncbi:uncharacterized protein J8A68_002877 [[Candida] subhashii]|uniref:Mating factor alpha n=1 Tax=[Candida] subhashii TaxID=561895 RepID=A0A8J5QK61_9ASCO|nr:uncharacterized protein J8A68_002877 [[Candida] subhashii]KAG7663628.1 hypothetical protein J8A68_002877 [[Candida] subhashii]